MELDAALQGLPAELRDAVAREWGHYVSSAREQGIDVAGLAPVIASVPCVWAGSAFIVQHCVRAPTRRSAPTPERPRRATRRASPATRRQAPSWTTPISQISSKKQGVMVAMIPFKLSLPDADMPLEPIQVSGRRDGVPGVFEIHGGERRLRPLSHH